MAQDAPNERHGLQPAQDALATKRIPSAITRCNHLARTRCAGWEEAARPQGLFHSYACRNGRGARDLHEISYGIVPEYLRREGGGFINWRSKQIRNKKWKRKRVDKETDLRLDFCEGVSPSATGVSPDYF